MMIPALPMTIQLGTPRHPAREPRLRRNRTLMGTWKSLAFILLAFVSVLSSSAQTTPSTNVETLVADFNHDGIPDLLTLSPTSATGTIAFGTVPYGTFNPTPKVAIAPGGCVSASSGAISLGNLVIADFNGDGIPDYFFNCNNSGTTQTTAAGVMLGNGDGTFTPSATLNAPYTAGGVAGDFNKDGKLDLVLITYPNGITGANASTPALLFFAGNGDGTFATPVSSPLGASATFQPGNYLLSSPVAADVDGDGYPDILLNAAYGYTSTNYNGATLVIGVFGNKKDGTFGVLTQGVRVPDVTAATGTYPAASPLKVLAGHFSSLITTDFVVPDTGTTPGLLFIKNTSTSGTFSLAAGVRTASAGLQNAATASFTGSGFTDLAIANGSRISALINDRTGVFTAGYSALSVASTATLFTLADANGDGYTDLYTASVLGGSLSLAVNLVTGSATATTAPFSLPAGIAALSATWPGNINLSGSSATKNQTVNATPTTIILTSSKNPSNAGDSVSFTAQLASSVQTATLPTGAISISDGSTVLGSGTPDSTGSLTVATSALSAGTHSVRAAFAGDSFFAASTSTILSQVVTQPAAVAPTLTWAPGPVTVGTALTSTQLNAVATNATGATVPGTYVYTPPAGTILSTPGSQILSVAFTPTNLVTYKAASLSVPITVLPATQSPLTTNLLLNPGAELGLVNGAIPNWTPAGPGSPTLDSGTFDDGILPHTGSYDFLGRSGASDSLSQTVSILSGTVTATLIDTGAVSANLSFWAQGLNQGTPSDDASVTLTFLNASGASISSVNSGEIDSHNSAWQNFTKSYPVPAGTRSIAYTMNFILHAGSDLDAFVDDNSLILTTPPAATATATTLALTSGTTAVSTVAQGTPVTLTATVLAGTTPVTPGQVNFCDASFPTCTDIHLLGTAQLIANGTATIKFIPGIGTHTYKAVFLGTTNYSNGGSTNKTLAVTGAYPSTTNITATGAAGNYTLAATTTGIDSSTVYPTGIINFSDSTGSNAILASVPLTASKSLVSFQTGSSLQIRSLPQSIAYGDFNGDGKTDLVTSDIESGNLFVFIGMNNGTYSGASILRTGSTANDTGQTYGVSVADFNADGNLDIITSDGVDTFVFLGRGDGTFSAPVITRGAANVSLSIAVADLDGDGYLDIVLTGQNAGPQVFLGKGDGSFKLIAAPQYLNLVPSAISLGDFNNDGKPDIAVGSEFNKNVTILLGNGDGTFSTNSNFATGDTVEIAVGDFDGNGTQDIATANFSSNTLSIMTGKGDGTFSTAQTVTGIGLPFNVGITDFNQDGKPDLIATSDTDNTVWILLGKGDGTFALSATPSAGLDPSGLVFADVDGDGIPDLTVLDSSASKSAITTLLTRLTQTATAAATNISPIGTGTHQIIASYAGDNNYSHSTSTPIPLTAQQIPTTTTLTPSLNPSPAATPVTFIATISPSVANTLTATGSILFTDGTNPLATVTLSPTGTATYTTSTLIPATHTIRAVYTGDTNFATSTSNLISQVVQPAAGLTFSTRNLTFGNQTVGTQSAPQSVLVTNLTGVTINIADILLILGPAPSDYLQTNTCPAVFLANATCTLNVSFAPHGVGLKSAGIEIDDDSTPSSQSVNFTGTGTGGILQVNPGNLKTIAGTGTAGYTGDNGLATAAQLNLPAGVVVDPTGIVYIADELNNVVRKVDLSGTITTIAGTGTQGYTGDSGPATAATLNHPATLTLDPAGNLYLFDDGNNVVRKITTSTGIITTFAGTGTAGHAGDGGPATSARLNQPQGGKFDKAGNLYIPDCVGSNLRKVDTKGIITTVAGNFTAGFSGDGGPATSAQLYCPSGVDIDAAGNLYIADDLNHRIRKVDTTGIITTIAGDGTAAAIGDGGPAASAELNLPNDLALDASGNLYIADSGNNRIRKIDTTGTITTVAGGLQNAGSAGVNTPLSLTIAPSGNLYFVDSGNNAVRELFPAGATPFPATAVATSASPQTLTLSNIGNVDVSIASSQSFTMSGNATDFALTGGTCLSGATLTANGGSCTLQITFTPTAIGLRTLTVSIADTALNSPQSFTISGTGVTLTPTVTWTPAPSSIPYGTPLGPQQLNAVATTPTGSTIAGTLTYTPAAGAILPAGPRNLSVTFTPTDTVDYTAVTAIRTITVTQAAPTLTWATPAPIVQGTALSATQLNATATGVTGTTLPGTFTYTPAAGTIPAAGTQTLAVLFTPTDTLDYTTATTTVRLTVTGLTLTSFTPAAARLGDPATTITLTGTGFTTATVSQVNGVSIPTTFVNPTTLTAVIPATSFTTTGTLTITVANPATSSRSQALPFTVTAPTASVTLTGPSTTQPSTQPTLALTVTNPYPVPLTATFTLAFTSNVTPTVDDPAIQFANGGRTFTFTVAANSTTVPTIQIQAGTVAGTITVPLVLTAAGVNVTPTTVQPLTIVVPASVPAVTTATITRATGSFTVTIHGFSNTREVATAAFHFLPATGAQIDTPDVTIPVGTIFSGWFTSAPSVPYGSTFTYTQVFNVSDTAANIGSVQVTLTNSVGVSTTYTAQ